MNTRGLPRARPSDRAGGAVSSVSLPGSSAWVIRCAAASTAASSADRLTQIVPPSQRRTEHRVVRLTTPGGGVQHRHDLDQFAVSTGLSVPRAPEKWTRDVAAARPGASRLKAVQALDGCFTAISRCSRTMPARGRRAPRRRAARPTSREVRRRRTQARAQRPAGADAAWLKLGLSGFE